MMAVSPTALDYLETGVNPAKLIPYVAAPIAALFGDMPWSGVPQVWSEVASQPTSQLYASWWTGKLDTTQANAARQQQAAQLKKAGATDVQIQAADAALVKYMNTPVDQGGAGGVTGGLSDVIKKAITGNLWILLAVLLGLTVVVIATD